jgi:hypothetical protein
MASVISNHASLTCPDSSSDDQHLPLPAILDKAVPLFCFLVLSERVLTDYGERLLAA